MVGVQSAAPTNGIVMSVAIRILLIEDDPSDQKLIRTALENGLEHVQIEVVDKRHLIQDALNADRVDIVLSDYELITG